MFFHLAQEKVYRQSEGGNGVAEHPPKVWKNACIIPCQHGALQLNGVDERQCVGDLLKRPTDQLQVKPGARKPGREIGKQCAADTTDLLIVQDTAKQQTKRNEKQ